MKIQKALEDFIAKSRKELLTIEDVTTNMDAGEVDFSRIDANVVAIIELAQIARQNIQRHCDEENESRLRRGNR